MFEGRDSKEFLQQLLRTSQYLEKEVERLGQLPVDKQPDPELLPLLFFSWMVHRHFEICKTRRAKGEEVPESFPETMDEFIVFFARKALELGEITDNLKRVNGMGKKAIVISSVEDVHKNLKDFKDQLTPDDIQVLYYDAAVGEKE